MMTPGHRLPAALLAAALLLIAACGQKGALYLPGDQSEIQTELPQLERPGDTDEAEADGDAGPEEPAEADDADDGAGVNDE